MTVQTKEIFLHETKGEEGVWNVCFLRYVISERLLWSFKIFFIHEWNFFLVSLNEREKISFVRLYCVVIVKRFHCWGWELILALVLLWFKSRIGWFICDSASYRNRRKVVEIPHFMGKDLRFCNSLNLKKIRNNGGWGVKKVEFLHNKWTILNIVIYKNENLKTRSKLRS